MGHASSTATSALPVKRDARFPHNNPIQRQIEDFVSPVFDGIPPGQAVATTDIIDNLEYITQEVEATGFYITTHLDSGGFGVVYECIPKIKWHQSKYKLQSRPTQPLVIKLQGRWVNLSDYHKIQGKWINLGEQPGQSSAMENYMQQELDLTKYMATKQIGPIVYHTHVFDIQSRKDQSKTMMISSIVMQQYPYSLQQAMCPSRGSDAHNIESTHYDHTLERIQSLLYNKLETMIASGYIHNDLKLSNIVVNGDYTEVAIIDFGLNGISKFKQPPTSEVQQLILMMMLIEIRFFSGCSLRIMKALLHASIEKTAIAVMGTMDNDKRKLFLRNFPLFARDGVGHYFNHYVGDRNDPERVIRIIRRCLSSVQLEETETRCVIS
jgi:serine/threonine protein kinase